MVKKSKMSGKTRRTLVQVSLHLTLIIVSLVVLFPFLYMVVTSLKDIGESYQTHFFPKEITFKNYITVLFDKDAMEISIFKSLWNTILVTIPPLVIGLFTSTLAAFAFAKLRFKNRKITFGIILFSMMLPGVVTLIPSYAIYDALGMVDTYVPLIVPGMFTSAGTIFFMVQYIRTLPNEVIDAAKMDGLSHFGIFMRIILPLSKPALIAQLLLGFIGGYNNFFGAFLYLSTENLFTLQLYLNGFKSTFGTDWTVIMAGAVVSLIPIIILFISAQKSFIKGIVMGAVKG